jgi:hypothetical protein
MATAVKRASVKPAKSKVNSPLSRLYGLYKGQIFYESNDIFFSYKFKNQCDVVL